MELHQRERYFIENFECVNKATPNMTRKETNKKYNDKTKDYRKQYYKDNRDRINNINNEKINCVCGSVIRKGEKYRHTQSIKHKKYIENINKNI